MGVEAKPGAPVAACVVLPERVTLQADASISSHKVRSKKNAMAIPAFLENRLSLPVIAPLFIIRIRR